ncbi:MAG: hypothetical protein OEV10_02505 [Gammaproteobacteria bacterium]|jgi:hypothetical protein|nr:hypothetical protein [Gammaproteobacteria bacterium]MDH3846525.1 hypothetical protein [Gammaproteobacteria bacterium]MDH3862817.1 hypothetical protein [Gammaproteobacteria bacterium]MDH3905416.1 hypothetical protein [Gammaproteobacteria bacterium]MDH3955022.1 hypothetical protein [Gammaproteobacteria bacterium]
MTYHVDRLYAAVSVLAGDGHIKQRLIKAYQENLDDIVEDDLPRNLKKAFCDLRSRLHCVAPLNGEGPVRASVRKMSVSEASECAVKVVDLYSKVIREAENLQDPLPLQHDAEKVPPFLVKSV